MNGLHSYKRLYWMQQKEALAILKSQRPPHRFTILLFIPTKLVIHYCTVFLTSLFNQVIRVAYKRTETILTRRKYKLGGEGKNWCKPWYLPFGWYLPLSEFQWLPDYTLVIDRSRWGNCHAPTVLLYLLVPSCMCVERILEFGHLWNDPTACVWS